MIRRRFSTSLKSWATVDPTSKGPFIVDNYLNGSFVKSKNEPIHFPDPLDDKNTSLQLVAHTSVDELEPFLKSLSTCSKSGLHNPLKNPQRFIEYGQLAHKLAVALEEKEIENFFAKLIQRVMPKSEKQCIAEIRVTRAFLKSFSGDSIRFTIGRGFTVPGDHPGQESKGYRWPYGPVAIVAPFNFPFEIPVLQAMGALFAGNKVIVKPSEKVSIVFDQFVRLMIACGAPKDDLLVLNCGGKTAEALVTNPIIRLTQFTGSSFVAEKLSELTHGKVRLEDAGYNWKILGPRKDISKNLADYIAWQCDQDAYAASGQKCSAQSCLFVHSDWNTSEVDIVGRMQEYSLKRNLKNLTIGPVLSWSTEKMLSHIKDIKKHIPGSKVQFGGEELKEPGSEKIPKQYGIIKPTALRCDIRSILSSDKAFEVFSTEVFGPLQIIVDYKTEDIDLVLKCMERLSHHLTCAVVSSDPNFSHKILSNTVNGTTYCGIRARTTGAPTNHWFGPSGDPRGAGIGTIEAIIQGWTCHREIVHDVLDPPSDFKGETT